MQISWATEIKYPTRSWNRKWVFIDNQKPKIWDWQGFYLLTHFGLTFKKVYGCKWAEWEVSSKVRRVREKFIYASIIVDWRTLNLVVSSETESNSAYSTSERKWGKQTTQSKSLVFRKQIVCVKVDAWCWKLQIDLGQFADALKLLWSSTGAEKSELRTVGAFSLQRRTRNTK